MKKITTGVLIASIFSGLIILSIENNYSFFQISVGFLIYLIPAIFISSFKSIVLAFILAVVTILYAYTSYQFDWHASWVGVLMSFVIGLPIYYYRIRKVKVPDGHKVST